MRKLITLHLTVKQLLSLGVHVGHSIKNSKNLSAWMFLGHRHKSVVINISKTFVALKKLEKYIQTTLLHNKRILFVDFEKSFTLYVIRYSMLCGELYQTTLWTGGLISNIKSVLFNCYKAYKKYLEDFHITHKDKKKIKSIYGLFWNDFINMPGLVYFTSVKKSRLPVLEMIRLNIITTGIVDTDTLSWNVKMPIPGNDDSIVCLNFFLYYITSIVLKTKMHKMKNWKDNIRVKERVEVYTKSWILTLIENKEQMRDSWYLNRLTLLLDLLNKQEKETKMREFETISDLREKLMDREREFYGEISKN